MNTQQVRLPVKDCWVCLSIFENTHCCHNQGLKYELDTHHINLLANVVTFGQRLLHVSINSLTFCAVKLLARSKTICTDAVVIWFLNDNLVLLPRLKKQNVIVLVIYNKRWKCRKFASLQKKPRCFDLQEFHHSWSNVARIVVKS